ncbi:aldo/keto reductase [Pectinatus frisingensis]|uniref:aldo/keto reductase n=1 Tax=Pectinatus frisingensis TaxID=865 RepID=UPI0018C67735|nr:aldo/keto reductase [Pectinatus frisingensis]
MDNIRIKMSINIEFSRIALGFWRLNKWNMSTNELVNFLGECLELGITTMDNADIYGDYTCEELFGRAIKADPSLRRKMEIITKCTIVYPSATARVKYYNSSENYIISQIEKSLKNMNIDEIETLLLHRPDPYMDPDGVARAFDKLYKSGKVKSFGVSNYSSYEYEMLKSYVNVPLITDQIELSCLNIDNIDNGTVAFCMKEKIHPMIWSPLAGGRILTGTSETEKRLKNVLMIIKNEIGADSIDVVAFSWLLSHPAKLVPITGSGKITHIKRMFKALKYKLTPEQWFMIWTASKGHKIP